MLKKATLDRSSLALVLGNLGSVAGLTRLFSVWRARLESRRALSRLDEHLLHDIGISPLDAADESRRPFWRD